MGRGEEIMDNIIKILDHFWAQVAGTQEFRHTQWAICTYIKVKSFSNGKVDGVGLWGSKGVPFMIDFGSDFDKLEFECECQSFQQAIKNKDVAPCSHIIRGLLEIEGKIKECEFETIHKDRISQVIPF